MGALAGLQDESQDEKKEEKKEAKPEAVAAVHAVEAPAKSCLVLCGSTDWVAAAKGAAGKQKQKQDGAQGDQFDSPVVVGGALAGVRVSSCPSALPPDHVLAFGDGKVFAWGQNSHGQLGLGAKAAWCVPGPTEAKAWSAPGTPVSAACGKNHTLVLYADGAVASAGCGERGALGHGDKAKDMPEMSHDPRVVEAVSDAVCIAAGTDFSLAGASTGKVYSWGWTEFGKLGQGDDGCYNTKDSSIKLTYTAAGAGSLLCGDSSTAGLGWPEYRGRPFTKTAGDGMLFVWGVLKGTHGEGATHPVPNYDLQGWAIDKHCLGVGASHCALGAEGSAVAWALMPVAYGQLGYGDAGPKSSHRAKELEALKGAVRGAVRVVGPDRAATRRP
ncbi:hypothetical protein JL720_10394 [Aureococcus anophagefferens]|nr:hypothetical protein JL720_10394 [Aureococcus anophagefferens]